ncbi:C-C motif chemokine 19-like [Polypterus senegalus]|uniref:C-C motif chemokine 19-like n=1 Tax=Polypterus senegalus TaxID=55291 RepID=UPI001963E866|nr:C-C motif chemokine 19-like [Polypterus senegalus]
MASRIPGLFLVLLVLWCCTWETFGDSNTVQDCCLHVSNHPIPFKLVRSYKKQELSNGCLIEAIVFITIKNRSLCAPVNSLWVTVLQKKIDKKLQSYKTVPGRNESFRN